VEEFPLHIPIEQLKIDLAGSLGVKTNQLLNLELDDKQNLILEYSSVNSAGSASGILTKYDRYRLLPRFISDPCGGPLEELLENPNDNISEISEIAATFGVPVVPSSMAYGSLYDDNEVAPFEQEKSSLRKRQDAVDTYVNEHPRYASTQTTSTGMYTARRKIRDYNWAEEECDRELVASAAEKKEQLLALQSPRQSLFHIHAAVGDLTPAANEDYSLSSSGYNLANVDDQQDLSSNWFLPPLDRPGAKFVVNSENEQVWKPRGRSGGIMSSRFATQESCESSSGGLATLISSKSQSILGNPRDSIPSSQGSDWKPSGEYFSAAEFPASSPQEVFAPQNIPIDVEYASSTGAVVSDEDDLAIVKAIQEAVKR
jgi:hypothetical protein